MHAEPEAWAKLMAWTADVTGRFLRAQVLAGASAAQLFDSWAGALSLADYAASVAPASAAAIAHVRDLTYSVNDVDRNVPIVHFGVGTGELLKEMHNIGADVVGVDYRVPLDEANRRLGGAVPVQGNVDPALLAAPWPVLEAHVRDVLERGRSAPSHVLNLGHGVPPETDPDVLTRLVSLVHDVSAAE
jgi:uroporphyrinogen decarboxylase